MPTYEYECRACGHAFETMHSMTAPVLRKCPECGKLKLERLISGGAGVIFKGSGFYETDYKAKRGGASDRSSTESKTSETAKSGASETKTETKSDAKKDGKPAAKPESKPKKD